MNPIAKEPVAVAAVTAIISWLAAKYAIKVSPEQASEIAGVVLVIAGGFARQLVTPTAKLEYKVEPSAEPAESSVTPYVTENTGGPRIGQRHGQISPARTVPPSKSPGPPPPPPAGGTP